MPKLLGQVIATEDAVRLARAGCLGWPEMPRLPREKLRFRKYQSFADPKSARRVKLQETHSGGHLGFAHLQLPKKQAGRRRWVAGRGCSELVHLA